MSVKYQRLHLLEWELLPSSLSSKCGPNFKTKAWLTLLSALTLESVKGSFDIYWEWVPVTILVTNTPGVSQNNLLPPPVNQKPEIYAFLSCERDMSLLICGNLGYPDLHMFPTFWPKFYICLQLQNITCLPLSLKLCQYSLHVLQHVSKIPLKLKREMLSVLQQIVMSYGLCPTMVLEYLNILTQNPNIAGKNRYVSQTSYFSLMFKCGNLIFFLEI